MKPFLVLALLAGVRLAMADPFPIWRESWPGYSLSDGKMTVLGNRAFVLTDQGLSILSLDGDNPSKLGFFPMSPGPQAIALDGDRAYIGSVNGLLVLDISDPRSPRLIARPFTKNVFGLAMHKGLLVMGCSQSYGGASFIKYLNPASPGETWPGTDKELRISGRSFDAIHSMGDYVAFTAKEQIRLVELNDPTTPRVLDPVSRTGNAPDAATTIQGNRAYFASSIVSRGQRPRHRLETIDLSDPSHPQSLAALLLEEVIWPESIRDLTVDGIVLDLKVANNRAYLATSSGLLIYDISDPALPQLSAQLPLGDIGSIAVDGERIFALGPPGLMRLKPDLSLGGISDLPGNGISQLQRVGSALLTEIGNRLYPYRLEGGAIQRVLPEGFPMSFFKPLRGSLVCGLRKGALQVVDFSDPAKPRTISSTLIAPKYPNSVSLISTSETRVLVRSFESGAVIELYDLEDPSQPRLLGSTQPRGFGPYLLPSGQVSVDNRGQSLVLTGWLNPRNPQLLSEIRISGPANITGVIPSQNYLFVLGVDPPSLNVIDVTEPVNPRILGRPYLFSKEAFPLGLRVVERRAYVPLGRQGFVVVDWTDPTRLRTLAKVQGVTADDVLEHEGKIYVATGEEGLAIYEWGEARWGITGSETKGSQLLLRLEGTPGLEVGLERSGDMRLWESWKPAAGLSRVTLGREPIVLKDELDIANRQRFYRLTRQ